VSQAAGETHAVPPLYAVSLVDGVLIAFLALAEASNAPGVVAPDTPAPALALHALDVTWRSVAASASQHRSGSIRRVAA
jgi:hypothetical protein